MKRKDLNGEQLSQVERCKTTEDILALANKEGYSLSDDELADISGGSWNTADEECKAGGRHNFVHEGYESMTRRKIVRCTKCGATGVR